MCTRIQPSLQIKIGDPRTIEQFFGGLLRAKKERKKKEEDRKILVLVGL